MKRLILLAALLAAIGCGPTAPNNNECAGKWVYLGTDRVMYLTVTDQDSLFLRYYLPGDTLPILWGRGTPGCYSTYRYSAYTSCSDSCEVIDVHRSGAQLVVSQTPNNIYTFTKE